MLLIIIGCTPSMKNDNQNNQDEKDENIATIGNVLENTFSGPDKDFQDVMKLRKDKASRSEDEEFLTSFNQYMEDAFKPYFTDEYYEEFIATYGTTFLDIAYSNNYEMNVKNVEYEKTESDDSIYDFTFKLLYKKEASDQWNEKTVKGQANLDDNNKIENMLIQDTEFLIELK